MLDVAHDGFERKRNIFLAILCALILNSLGLAQSLESAKINPESGVIPANYWTLGVEHSSTISSSKAAAKIDSFNPTFAYSYFHTSHFSMGLTFQAKDIKSLSGGTEYKILQLGTSSDTM